MLHTLPMCVHLYEDVHMCVCMCVCVYECACVCTCVYAYVCVGANAFAFCRYLLCDNELHAVAKTPQQSENPCFGQSV